MDKCLRCENTIKFGRYCDGGCGKLYRMELTPEQRLSMFMKTKETQDN